MSTSISPRSPHTWPAGRLVAGLVALLALPSAGSAAAPSPGLAVDAPAPDTLTIDDPATYERSADLLVDDALDLEDTDPEKYRKLRAAGRLYHQADVIAKARTTTLHAGIAAFHAGAHAAAAHIFLDAAEVSLNRGIRYGAESAADRAGWVLRNGELTPEERESVLRRVRYLDGIEVRRSEEALSSSG